MSPICILLTVFILKLVEAQDTAEVDRLEKLINTAIENSNNYVLPTDARQYQAADTTVREFGEFDFIIVGGGSSGSVIARRLATIGDWKVLILEAGKFGSEFLQFPRFFVPQSFSDYNWGYKTVPQTTACLGNINHISSLHQGRGVGGSTLIKQNVYNRGHPENYNQWARTLLDSTWSYENLLKYFKMSEQFRWTNSKAPVDLQYHGTSGPIQVEHRTPGYFLNDAFLDGSKELGYDVTDYNSRSPTGASILQLLAKSGSREDTGSAFVKPVLNWTNLNVSTDSFVTKIEINKYYKEAEGVIFTKHGITYRARANKEIILAAGALSTPKLLMLSGIGPRAHLRELDIDLIEDLEVGSRLQDQASASLLFVTNVVRPVDKMRDWIESYLKGQGDLTGVSRAQAVGFYPVGSTDKRGVPTIRLKSDIALKSTAAQKYLEMTKEIDDAIWSTSSNRNAVSFVAELVSPKSIGTFRLKSKDPFDYPLINPKYLSDSYNEDIETMYNSLNLIFDLIQTSPYKNLDTKYLSESIPGCKHLEFKSKPYWYCYLRQTTLSANNPSGTCPMGISKYRGGVVDSKLRVLGVSRLRIADASVFPTPISGYTTTVSIMIGEKVSDDIKAQYFFN